MFRALVAASLIFATGALAEGSVEVASVAAVSAAEPGAKRVAPPVVPIDPSIARDIAEWQRLRAGRGTFSDAIRFLETHSDWPGLALLRKKAEAEMPIGARAE